MSDIFTLDMLAADNGDALWLRFGKPGAVKNIFVDVGYATSLKRLLDDGAFGTPTADAPFVVDLLVITHTDQDHIGGAVKLLAEAKANHFRINHVWFNGYKQLFPSSSSAKDSLGYRTGEKLSAAIEHFRIPHNMNPADPDEAMCASGCIVVEDDLLPSTCVSGLKLTVLGPDSDGLDALRDEWKLANGGKPGNIYKETLRRLESESDRLGGKRIPGSDAGIPNGSSIALLAEYAGVRVLLGADAFAAQLLNSLDRAPASACSTFDIFKLPHHGSVGNLTPQLIDRVGARHYLISTNGGTHEHPHKETIQLVLDASTGKPPNFHFNYGTTRERIRKEFAHTALEFGDVPGACGLRIDLMALRDTARGSS